MFAYRAAAAWCLLTAILFLSLQALAMIPANRRARNYYGRECQTCWDSGLCPPNFEDALTYTELEFQGYPHRRFTTRDGQGTPSGGSLYLWKRPSDTLPWLRYQVLYRNQADLHAANVALARERGIQRAPQFHFGAPSSMDSRHIEFDPASRDEPNEDAIVLRFRQPKSTRDIHFLIRSGQHCHISTSVRNTEQGTSTFRQARVAYSEIVLPRVHVVNDGGDVVPMNTTIGPR